MEKEVDENGISCRCFQDFDNVIRRLINANCGFVYNTMLSGLIKMEMKNGMNLIEYRANIRLQSNQNRHSLNI
jgi:hypothetical protein